MGADEARGIIAEWAKSFEARILEMETALDSRLTATEKRLYRALIEVAEWFDLDAKTIKATAKNMRALRGLDRIFDEFEREWILRDIDRFAADLLEVSGMTAAYYDSLNMSKKEVVSEVAAIVREIIGIDSEGGILKGGYLDKLAKAPEVRSEIRDFMLKSIINKRTLTDFKKGLNEIVIGTDGEGALKRYWRQYAFDVFNEVHEVANKATADRLGLKWFIYQGSIIPTTRDFCRKKAGKAFNTDEAKRWKDDPDLIDKKTKDSYNPLIERGRYNCRHFLTYISEDLAKQMRNE